MKKMLILAILCLVVVAQAEPMIGRVKITSPDEVARLSQLGFTIYNDELRGVVDLVLAGNDMQRLTDLGYIPENLLPLAQPSFPEIDPQYHTYEELTSALQSLAQQYPTLCKLDSIGRAQQFPRTMWGVKLSDNVQTEEDELAVIFLGTHHASEVMGMETLLYMINYYLTNYGLNTQITTWMNNYEIYFVPLVNPDGHYAVTSDINLFWRKNARDINGNGIYYEYMGGTWWTDDHEGIDLNRNYNWYWNLGGSTDPWAYDYRGATPSSESENQAVCSWARTQRAVCGLSFHSYGEVVIAPWIFQGQSAPDQDVINTIAAGLASHFIGDDGQPYIYYADEGRVGRCPNWFYGYAGAIFYDVEVNPYPVFIPPGSQLAERTYRYMQGAQYLLERLSGPGITGHVTDASTGQPLAARVEIQGRISTQVRPRYAEPAQGRFTRLLNNGTYTVFAAMPGYQMARISNVVVNNGLTPLEIHLTHLPGLDGEVSLEPTESDIRFRVKENNAATVNFELEMARAQQIQLEIYDLLGRRVAEVVNGYRSEGAQTITFTPTQLPSGVYIAVVSGADFKQAQKVVVVK